MRSFSSIQVAWLKSTNLVVDFSADSLQNLIPGKRA